MAKIHTERGALVQQALRMLEAVVPPGQWRELGHDRILGMTSDELREVVAEGYRYFEALESLRKRSAN